MKRLLPGTSWLAIAGGALMIIGIVKAGREDDGRGDNIDLLRTRLTAIETQLAHDANCIATLEVLQQAREQAEAGK